MKDQVIEGRGGVKVRARAVGAAMNRLIALHVPIFILNSNLFVSLWTLQFVRIEPGSKYVFSVAF